MALIPRAGLHGGAGSLSRRSRGLLLQRCGVCGAHALPVPGAHSCGRVQGVALFRLPWRGTSGVLLACNSPRAGVTAPACSRGALTLPFTSTVHPLPVCRSRGALLQRGGRSLSPLTLPGSFTDARRGAVPVPVHSRRVYSHGSRVLHGSPSLTLQRLTVPRRDTHAVTLQGHNGSRLTPVHSRCAPRAATVPPAPACHSPPLPVLTGRKVWALTRGRAHP